MSPVRDGTTPVRVSTSMASDPGSAYVQNHRDCRPDGAGRISGLAMAEPGNHTGCRRCRWSAATGRTGRLQRLMLHIGGNNFCHRGRFGNCGLWPPSNWPAGRGLAPIIAGGCLHPGQVLVTPLDEVSLDRLVRGRVSSFFRRPDLCALRFSAGSADSRPRALGIPGHGISESG